MYEAAAQPHHHGRSAGDPKHLQPLSLPAGPLRPGSVLPGGAPGHGPRHEEVGGSVFRPAESDGPPCPLHPGSDGQGRGGPGAAARCGGGGAGLYCGRRGPPDGQRLYCKSSLVYRRSRNQRPPAGRGPPAAKRPGVPGGAAAAGGDRPAAGGHPDPGHRRRRLCGRPADGGLHHRGHRRLPAVCGHGPGHIVSRHRQGVRLCAAASERLFHGDLYGLLPAGGRNGIASLLWRRLYGPDRQPDGQPGGVCRPAGPPPGRGGHRRGQRTAGGGGAGAGGRTGGGRAGALRRLGGAGRCPGRAG